jgi:cytosine/adenosine deaminase-related metal-dependent hydrolase
MMSDQLIKIYSARWVLPVTSPPIDEGAVAIDGAKLVAVDTRKKLTAQFPAAQVQNFNYAAILPGLVNTHTHLELTAMRGYLENEETNFFAWLRKLTVARLERMTTDDILDSATWGACEAARAGITAVGDASDLAAMSVSALRAVGLRGIVFQESFGPDPSLARQNFESLQS